MTSTPPAPTGLNSETSAVRLKRRSFATYSARLKACQRLARRNHAWNASLVGLTTSATIASVGVLSEPTMYGENGDTLLVCVSILTLVASLVTSGLDYSGRSRDMFVNYRKVQRLSLQAEAAETDSSISVDLLLAEYNALMDESENHSSGDHYRAKRQRDKDSGEDVPRWPGHVVVLENVLTFAPYLSLALAIALTYPLVSSFF